MSLSLNGIAFSILLISVPPTPTSIGAMSSNCVVVVRKKLKSSAASLKAQFSPLMIASLFLKNEMSLIVLSTKEGAGLVRSEPASLGMNLNEA